MLQLQRLTRAALLALAAVLVLLVVFPGGASAQASRTGLGNVLVVPSTTIVTSAPVVGRARLSRTGSGSRSLTLVAGLALLLGGVAVGFGEPDDRRA